MGNPVANRHPATFWAVLALGLVATSPAWASVDIDCWPALKVSHPSFNRCDTTTVLAPGNDTRGNLLLLLYDRDEAAPDFLPTRTPPAAPLSGDAVPFLDWRDLRDRFVAPMSAKAGADFSRGEGSRCLSDAGGATAFTTALVAAPGLPPEERDALIAARKAVAPTCNKGGGADPIPSVTSPAGQGFATYLRGAADFYQARFEPALDAFAKLHGNADGWLANAGDYMVARTQVNRMQEGAFDEYGDFAGSAHVDRAVAAAAMASLEAYLRDHPHGSYAASARGLMRRVDWLTGDTSALAAKYAALVAMPVADRGIDDATLAEEIGSKLLPVLKPETTRDPLLLAALDLMTMRRSDGSAHVYNDRPRDTPLAEPKEERVDLEAQRAAFATAVPLFDFLVATQAFYVDHDPALVLKLLPDDTKRRDGDHLWFGRQVLRGLALEAKGDRNARGFWKELYPGTTRPLDQLTVELALALHDEKAGTLDDVFAKGSIVASPAIRERLLIKIADATLLRRVARDADAPARERQVALFTLLYKDATRARYADFGADVALVPPDAPTTGSPGPFAGQPPPLGLFTRAAPGELDCPFLSMTAARLAHDPAGIRERLCLAEFMRVTGINLDTFEPLFAVSRDVASDDLGGGPSQFPGKPYERIATYRAIIADRGAPAVERAFALYRAVQCYAPSGVNDCGGPELPKAQRKAWYEALKRDYPASRWAKSLAYWW